MNTPLRPLTIRVNIAPREDKLASDLIEKASAMAWGDVFAERDVALARVEKAEEDLKTQKDMYLDMLKELSDLKRQWVGKAKAAAGAADQWRWVSESLTGTKFATPKEAADYLRLELRGLREQIDALKRDGTPKSRGMLSGALAAFGDQAKEANAKDRRIQKFIEACQYVLDNSPNIYGDQSSACLWCDMGGAGWSTKGDGHHDDRRHICPVLRCAEAIAYTGDKDEPT